MLRLALFSTLLLSATAAHADTVTDYVSAGPTIGLGGEQDWLTGGADLDAGHRLSQTWLLHAHYGASWRIGDGNINGGTMLVHPERGVSDVRAGFLAEPCHGGRVCWFGGADAGYRFGYVDGVIVTPQFGLDITAGSVHVRPAVEWTISYARSGVPELNILPDMALQLGVSAGYAW